MLRLRGSSGFGVRRGLGCDCGRHNGKRWRSRRGQRGIGEASTNDILVIRGEVFGSKLKKSSVIYGVVFQPWGVVEALKKIVFTCIYKKSVWCGWWSLEQISRT